jgi:hypothetical protein
VEAETRDIRSNVKLNRGMSWKKSIQHSTKLHLHLRKKPITHYIWSIAENFTLGKLDQKYFKTFDMWYWRRMEINWTDRVRNSITKNRGGEEWNTPQKITSKNKVKWIGTPCIVNAITAHC